jgi:hypothetical protein
VAASIFASEEGEATSNEEAAGELLNKRYEEIKGNYLTLVRDEGPGGDFRTIEGRSNRTTLLRVLVMTSYTRSDARRTRSTEISARR